MAAPILETFLELALPASLALAAAFVAREVLAALLHAAARDGWAAARTYVARRRDRRGRIGTRARDGNGG